MPRAGLLVGNLVPHPSVGSSVLATLDVFVANEHEAAAILDQRRGDSLHAAEQLRRLAPP